MRNLMALLYYLCALFGCSVGGTTIEHHNVIDGVDILDSRVRITERIARFDCKASRSGQCHYSLFRSGCPATTAAGAATDPQCAQPTERFALAAGTTREIVGIAEGFKVCASETTTAMDADCKPQPN
ncbi:hypothetical protein SAMN04487939_102183 [Lysobacter sp. yr284]|uniref:hypothetical protein n=1 Tax=Lysobacter sp. yr284 TaxID=1761791 RepID=UPI00089490EF|nr:hypothetical protein [Lysobacter sp. yr284]SDY44728.1 hypothetical protein SAMN04487939_102183 [Lysobacter sp. yr284]